LGNRPTRLIADRRRGTKILIGKTEITCAFAERRNLQREIRPANAGTRNRADPHEIGAFPDAAGFQASDFRLSAPRLALLGKKSATTPRKRDKDEGADEIQTNSARHAGKFDEFI
jgi:hypothetical protein